MGIIQMHRLLLSAHAVIFVQVTTGCVTTVTLLEQESLVDFSDYNAVSDTEI